MSVAGDAATTPKPKSHRLAFALAGVTCQSDWRAVLLRALTECVRLPKAKGPYLPPELLSLVAEYCVACFTDMLRCSAWTLDRLLDVIPEYMRDDAYLFRYAIADHCAPPCPPIAAAAGSSGSESVQRISPAVGFVARWFGHVLDRAGDIRLPRLVPAGADDAEIVPCTDAQNLERMKRIITELMTCEGENRSSAGAGGDDGGVRDAGGLQVYMRRTVSHVQMSRVMETVEEVWMNPPAAATATSTIATAATAGDAVSDGTATTTATAPAAVPAPAPAALYLKFYHREILRYHVHPPRAANRPTGR